MKVFVEGTITEIEKVKSVFDSLCFFNSEYCGLDIPCTECEVKQKLKIEYVVKE